MMMNFSRRLVEFTEELLLASWVAKNAARNAGSRRAGSREPKAGSLTLPVLPCRAMTSRLSVRLRDPLFLLCLTAGLLAFVVQSGELGTADTMHRLQTTHWIWTSQPQVFPNEYPEFGLRGRGGHLYSWYGIGQSLLMLPADLIGTWLAHLPVFSDYTDDPAVRSIVVSYITNILLNVLTALISFRLLRQLRFTTREAVAGVLALMFCTTHLHYTHNMMENNYIMLLTLVGLSYQYEWLRADNRRALFIGSAALGLNLLTRLTPGLDLIAAGVFLLAPLVVLAILLLVRLWKRLSPEVRAYGVTSLLLLLGYISFYARYTYWAGDFAWGDRYVSTAVELVALIAVPLLLRYRENLSKRIWRAGMALIAVSLVIQVASLAFWVPLEIYQMETLGHPTFVIALRFKNIMAFALGKMDAWGLNNESMTQDAWDYVHITTWNFLPFLLRRVGAVPGWVVKAAFAVWIAGIAALAWVLRQLGKAIRGSASLSAE